MDSTRACLHYLKARQLPVDRLFDQLSKALADWTDVLESVEPKVKAITPTTIHFAEKTLEAMCIPASRATPLSVRRGGGWFYFRCRVAIRSEPVR